MRFVVDLFRYIVLIAVAIVVIGGSFLLFSVISADGTGTVLDGMSIATAFGLFILGIISLGGLAGLISTHDRIAEISDHMDEISESLHRIAYQSRGGDEREPRIE